MNHHEEREEHEGKEGLFVVKKKLEDGFGYCGAWLQPCPETVRRVTATREIVRRAVSG